MSFLYPLTMICFGIYIGTYNNCKPAIEYIHETVVSMCSNPNKGPQKRHSQVQTESEADEDKFDESDDDDMPELKPIFE
jgi:hypothetical protein